ncbi:MAG: TA system VapC family ribonuclease toxin [Candidatus Rokuibacteriota bacterium]
MSFAIDVNVLLYASDEASPFARRAGAFLAECAAGREILCLAWTTVVSYLRIATHPAIFASPLPPDKAMCNIEALLHLPHVRVLSEEEGFWGVYRTVTRNLVVRGNLVPDAHLAALLRQHGVRVLYSSDRDFRRFDFLEVRDPLIPISGAAS